MRRHKNVEQKIVEGRIPAFKDGTFISSIEEFNKLHEREKKGKAETVLKIKDKKE